MCGTYGATNLNSLLSLKRKTNNTFQTESYIPIHIYFPLFFKKIAIIMYIFNVLIIVSSV